MVPKRQQSDYSFILTILSRIFDENMSLFQGLFLYFYHFFAFVLERQCVQRDDAESKPLQVVHTGTDQDNDFFCVFLIRCVILPSAFVDTDAR